MLPRPTRQGRGGRGPRPLRSQTPHTVSPSRGAEREEGEEHRLEEAQTKGILSFLPNPGRPASVMVTIHLRKSHSASEALGQVEKPSWALGSSPDSTLMRYMSLGGSLLPFPLPSRWESPLAPLTWDSTQHCRIIHLCLQGHITHCARVMFQLPVSLAMEGTERRRKDRRGWETWTWRLCRSAASWKGSPFLGALSVSVPIFHPKSTLWKNNL